MTVRDAKLDELKPDDKNANTGTKRGREILDHSLRQFGAGRSVLLDKHGRIIAGNKTVEAARDIGLDDVIVVQTDGKQLVAVQRTDLDLDDGDQARLLAYADNRAGEVGLEWNPEMIALDLDAGLDLSELFTDDELSQIDYQHDQIKEKTEDLRPKPMFHVLISAPVDLALALRGPVEQLAKLAGVEVLYGANG